MKTSTCRRAVTSEETFVFYVNFIDFTARNIFRFYYYFVSFIEILGGGGELLEILLKNVVFGLFCTISLTVNSWFCL